MAGKPESPFDPKEFLSKIGKGRSIAKYRTSEIIFSQGDQADSVFFIDAGKVKLTVVSEQGKEAVVAVLGKGDFCGEGCLAGQPKRIATAAAMMDCEVMQLQKDAIIRVPRRYASYHRMAPPSSANDGEDDLALI
jgi:CRP/FNR family cyclic AMP-dependent transcriptional regulator